MEVLTPKDIEDRFGLLGGNIMQGRAHAGSAVLVRPDPRVRRLPTPRSRTSTSVARARTRAAASWASPAGTPPGSSRRITSAKSWSAGCAGSVARGVRTPAPAGPGGESRLPGTMWFSPRSAEPRCSLNWLPTSANAARRRRTSFDSVRSGSTTATDPERRDRSPRRRGAGRSRRAHERISAGDDVGTLAGLPVLVKDVEDVAGMRTTHGSLLHAQDPPATRDALEVRRLRAQGAIVVGKTNVPEFATDGCTDNRVFGPTRNPWAPTRSPGGSGRSRRGARRRDRTDRDRDRRRRIRADPRFLLRPGRAEADQGDRGARSDPDLDGLLDHGAARNIDRGSPTAALDDRRARADGDPTALPTWIPKPGRTTAAASRVRPQRTSPAGPLPDPVRETVHCRARDDRNRVGTERGADTARADLRCGNIDEDWFTYHRSRACALARPRGDRIQRRSLHPRGSWHRCGRASRSPIRAVPRRSPSSLRVRRALDELLGDDGLLVQPTMPTEGWIVGGDARRPEPRAPRRRLQHAGREHHGPPGAVRAGGRLLDGLPFGLQITGPRFRDDLVLEFGARWEQASPWPATAPGFTAFASRSRSTALRTEAVAEPAGKPGEEPHDGIGSPAGVLDVVFAQDRLVGDGHADRADRFRREATRERPMSGSEAHRSSSPSTSEARIDPPRWLRGQLRCPCSRTRSATCFPAACRRSEGATRRRRSGRPTRPPAARRRRTGTSAGAVPRCAHEALVVGEPRTDPPGHVRLQPAGTERDPSRPRVVRR